MRLAALFVALPFLLAGCGERTPGPAQTAAATAPDFSVETFGGETFRLTDHRGTPVVLNFWESW